MHSLKQLFKKYAPAALIRTYRQRPLLEPGKFKFLVIGAGRGGTSLLACLLDTHPDIEVGFEKNANAILGGESFTESSKHNLSNERIHCFYRSCIGDSRLSRKKIYGNKITTEQISFLENHSSPSPNLRIQVLKHFFEQYFACIKIVFILRDGRTCVRSKLARTNQTMEEACAKWKYSVEMYRFLSGKTNVLCIKYEDLVSNPETTLSTVCSFLGTTYHPIMLSGTMNDKMPLMYKQKKINTSPVTLDKISKTIEPFLRLELLELGYLSE